MGNTNCELFDLFSKLDDSTIHKIEIDSVTRIPESSLRLVTHYLIAGEHEYLASYSVLDAAGNDLDMVDDAVANFITQRYADERRTAQEIWLANNPLAA